MMSEHAEQVLLFRRAALHRNRYPELALLHAVPNWAGVKGPREGAARKAEGVRAGVPDVHLPVARGGYIGLYIEMKYGSNKPTPEQRRWLADLERAGHHCAVCWSADEAWAVLEAYLLGQLKRAA